MAPATSRRMVASVFLVALLLLVASETGTTKVAEARHCVSQSHRYKGHCASSTNCHHVCRTEGFPSGECITRHLVRSMCFCKKPC